MILRQKHNSPNLRIASIVFTGFFLLLINLRSDAQPVLNLDSLENVLTKTDLADTLRMETLKFLAYYNNDPKEGIEYANKLIDLALQKNNSQYIYHGYLHKGYKLQHMGEYNDALKCFFKSKEPLDSFDDPKAKAAVYGAIGDVYSILANHDKAIKYYRQATTFLNKNEVSTALAGIYLNMGDEYLNHKDYDSALYYFEQSEDVYQVLNNQRGIAYNLGNRGMVHANLGENQLAEQSINQAISILENLEDYYPVCFYLLTMADVYKGKKDFPEAIAYAIKSLRLAHKYQLKQQISDANQKLSELYEATGAPEKSLMHYKQFVAYRDSVINLKTVQKMANQQTKFEVSLRENEITSLEKDKKLQQTYIIIVVTLLLLSFFVILYFRQRFRNTRLKAEAQQKEHSTKVTNLLKTQETKALQAIVRGKEEERKHLAKDLHNHLGSLLATVKMNLNGLESPDKAKYKTIIHLVDQATQDVRNISHELNMGVSDDFGLLPALKELVNHLQKANQLEVTISAGIDRILLDSQSEILIYRIVQELVSNALKHAEASTLSISLTGIEEGNLVNILVEDNGKGFYPNELTKESKGIGLNSLQEMVEKLDGELNIDSSPKRGTVISIDLPIEIPQNLIEP